MIEKPSYESSMKQKNNWISKESPVMIHCICTGLGIQGALQNPNFICSKKTICKRTVVSTT
jgi:hypothetical protein